MSLSTAEAVLQKMDDMQKMRRILRSRDRDTKEEVITHTQETPLRVILVFMFTLGDFAV